MANQDRAEWLKTTPHVSFWSDNAVCEENRQLKARAERLAEAGKLGDAEMSWAQSQAPGRLPDRWFEAQKLLRAALAALAPPAPGMGPPCQLELADGSCCGECLGRPAPSQELIDAADEAHLLTPDGPVQVKPAPESKKEDGK